MDATTANQIAWIRGILRYYGFVRIAANITSAEKFESHFGPPMPPLLAKPGQEFLAQAVYVATQLGNAALNKNFHQDVCRWSQVSYDLRRLMIGLHIKPAAWPVLSAAPLYLEAA